MIIVKNRKMVVPYDDMYIGTTYDDDSERRIFRIDRYAQNERDLSALTFRLDIKQPGQQADTVILDKDIDERYIYLIWNITNSVLRAVGLMFVQIRAIDNEATVKWSTYDAALYVARHLNTPGSYTGSLTEIEQMEQDFEYMKSVVEELKDNLDYAHDAEAWAKGTRSGSAVPSTDPTYHNNSKYYSDQANTKATQAANSATAAANSATQAAETVADTNTRFNNAVASVTSDTEVIDARVGADGTTYPVLKTRLDTEHTQLKSHLQYAMNDLADNQIYLPSHPKKCFNASGTGYNTIDINSPTVNTEWNAYLIPCFESDEFTVFAVGGTTVYAWAFINASGNILSKSLSNATVNGVTVIAPSDAVYLVVNDKGGNGRVYNGVPLKERIKLYEKNHIFYIASGGDAYWSLYDVSPVTLTLGSNDYIIVIDEAVYTIAIGDILTAAASAGATVDYTNRTITSPSFVIYFDISTHTPKVINTVSTAESIAAISHNPVVFAAHFKSIRCGMLVEYMLEKRIGLAETGINALQDGGIPSFFEDDLSAKIPEIIANMNATGADGTSFVFITDLHWETNYKNSPALVKRVLDKTSVKNVFCGGDIINEGEKAEMAEVFLDCINHFRFVPNLGFFPIARGNHDDNSNWSTHEDVATYSFDDNTVYNLYYSQFADKVTRIDSDWGFYFDQEVIKTRYLFVDTRRNGLVISWRAIVNCLNEVLSGWHVIILMHFTLRNATTLFAGCDLLAHIVKAYNSRESGSYGSDYQTATYDFTNATGEIDLIIGGHTHADYAMDASDANNPAGIPIIATDTDSYRTTASIEGTVDSQCFDVVTVNYSAKTVKCVRIGRGSNRNFSY